MLSENVFTNKKVKMKKVIFIIASTILIFHFGHAQENKFIYGLKAGATYSNVYDSQGESFNADSKFGYTSGIFVTIPLGEQIAFQPEFLFGQRGFKATGKILGSTYSFTRTTSYLDVPLLFAYKPIELLTVVLGPQYAYLVQQKDVFATGSTSVLQEQEFQNDNLRKSVLGFVGGVDINLRHTVVGARVGLDAQNNNGNGTATTPRYKNVWAQMTFGFRLY